MNDKRWNRGAKDAGIVPVSFLPTCTTVTLLSMTQTATTEEVQDAEEDECDSESDQHVSSDIGVTTALTAIFFFQRIFFNVDNAAHNEHN